MKDDIASKWAKVGQLNAAIDRTIAEQKKSASYAGAVQIQRLKRQRHELMGLLPGIRLVKG